MNAKLFKTQSTVRNPSKNAETKGGFLRRNLHLQLLSHTYEKLKRILINHANMEFIDYSHRHGKELMQITHPKELCEITEILRSLDPFPHGKEKNETPKEYVSRAFGDREWEQRSSS